MISNDIVNLSNDRQALAMGTLRVDMIADFVCPWCYLGKRRLDAALAAVHGPRLLRWLPFQLNPDMPAAGMAFDEYLESKFGDTAAVKPGLDELQRAGREEGIEFRFDRIERVPNTLAAHQLMSLAVAEGVDALALAEDLLNAFFERGLDIGNRELLAKLADRRGLPRHRVLALFDDDGSRERLRQQEQEMRRGGVNGVPDFLVNERLMVLGAQPVKVLVDAFDRAMFGDESDQPASDSLH